MAGRRKQLPGKRKYEKGKQRKCREAVEKIGRACVSCQAMVRPGNIMQ
jgi:hypothetical protein